MGQLHRVTCRIAGTCQTAPHGWHTYGDDVAELADAWYSPAAAVQRLVRLTTVGQWRIMQPLRRADAAQRNKEGLKQATSAMPGPPTRPRTIQHYASKATNKVQALHHVRPRVLDLLHFGLRACRTGGPLQQHAAPQRCRQCAKPRPSWRMATPRPSIHGHVGRTNAGSVVAAKKRWPNASPRIQLYQRSQCTWQGSNPWRVCHCRTCPCDPQGRVGPQP